MTPGAELPQNLIEVYGPTGKMLARTSTHLPQDQAVRDAFEKGVGRAYPDSILYVRFHGEGEPVLLVRDDMVTRAWSLFTSFKRFFK